MQEDLAAFFQWQTKIDYLFDRSIDVVSAMMVMLVVVVVVVVMVMMMMMMMMMMMIAGRPGGIPSVADKD